MYYCKRCNELMTKVMRFEGGKSYQLYRCPVCYSETKQRPLRFDSEELILNNTETDNKAAQKGRKRKKGKK